VLNPLPKLTVTIDAYSIYLRDRIVQSSGFTGYSNNCKYLPGGYTRPPIRRAATGLQSHRHLQQRDRSPSVLTALYNNGVPITSIIDTINGGQSGSLTINSFVNGFRR
jgi:iron complex outermembrane receptor protein